MFHPEKGAIKDGAMTQKLNKALAVKLVSLCKESDREVIAVQDRFEKFDRIIDTEGY